MSAVGTFKRRQGKNKRSQNALKKFEAKVFENPKKVLFLRGESTSDIVADAMNDICHIVKPHFKKLQKRNGFHAFEGASHLEFLGFKNDCSLFAFGSHNKKRPHNLVLGRQFDFKVLDMIELGIVGFDPLALEKIKGQVVASVGSKPFMMFEGSEFDTEPFFVRLRNFFLDFFHGTSAPEITLDGVDRAILISLRSANGADAVVAPSDDCVGTKPQAAKGNAVVCFRHYAVTKTASVVGQPSTANRVSLTDIGPNFDFELRRVSFAQPADFKAACRLPREAIAHLQSLSDNVSADKLGNLRGQLHLGKQDVTKLNLRRFAAYKKRPRAAATGAEDVVDGEADADETGGAEEGRRRRRGRKTESNDDVLGPDTDI